MELDIRLDIPARITEIRVCDANKDTYTADVISHGCSVYFEDTTSCGEALLIKDEAHALNIIKGLQKAIDLGWFK
jgi:hypothetical protein